MTARDSYHSFMRTNVFLHEQDLQRRGRIEKMRKCHYFETLPNKPRVTPTQQHQQTAKKKQKVAADQKTPKKAITSSEPIKLDDFKFRRASFTWVCNHYCICCRRWIKKCALFFCRSAALRPLEPLKPLTKSISFCERLVPIITPGEVKKAKFVWSLLSQLITFQMSVISKDHAKRRVPKSMSLSSFA